MSGGYAATCKTSSTSATNSSSKPTSTPTSRTSGEPGAERVYLGDVRYLISALGSMAAEELVTADFWSSGAVAFPKGMGDKQ